MSKMLSNVQSTPPTSKGSKATPKGRFEQLGMEVDMKLMQTLSSIEQAGKKVDKSTHRENDDSD